MVNISIHLGEPDGLPRVRVKDFLLQCKRFVKVLPSLQRVLEEWLSQ